MDGDRPVVDGRDLLESGLQELVREVWNDAREYGGMLYGREDIKAAFFRGYNYDIHKLLISYFDGETSIPRDPIKKITDDFAREMDLRFAQEGKKVAMGRCDLTKLPDGSIHARINFFPQSPR